MMFTDPTAEALPITPDASGRYSRRVERAIVIEKPCHFREICRFAIPRDAGLVVLDLDKTCFLGLNMGELLGFELVAREAYGDVALDEAEDTRKATKLFLDWRHPTRGARYIRGALSSWTWPGLAYLLGLSLPLRFERTTRRLYRRLGSDPVQAIQTFPQMNLLHQLSKLPKARAIALATRLMRRFEGAQVISAEDVTWLRETWCPGAKIVLASGSPSPVVEAAAKHLGIQTYFGTEIEEVDGFMSAPPFFRPLSAHDLEPRRIAPLSSIHVNTGVRKIERLKALLERCEGPSVGITDTDHGEDHCWAEHFEIVVDLNSSAHFSPIVGAHSPLRSIVSARAKSRSGASGERVSVSPLSTKVDIERDIEHKLGQLARLRQAQALPTSQHAALVSAIRCADDRIEQAIAHYNAGLASPTALKEELRLRDRLSARLASENEAASLLTFSIRKRMDAARKWCERWEALSPGDNTVALRHPQISSSSDL